MGFEKAKRYAARRHHIWPTTSAAPARSTTRRPRPTQAPRSIRGRPASHPNEDASRQAQPRHDQQPGAGVDKERGQRHRQYQKAGGVRPRPARHHQDHRAQLQPYQQPGARPMAPRTKPVERIGRQNEAHADQTHRPQLRPGVGEVDQAHANQRRNDIEGPQHLCLQLAQVQIIVRGSRLLIAITGPLYQLAGWTNNKPAVMRSDR